MDGCLGMKFGTYVCFKDQLKPSISCTGSISEFSDISSLSISEVEPYVSFVR